MFLVGPEKKQPFALWYSALIAKSPRTMFQQIEKKGLEAEPQQQKRCLFLSTFRHLRLLLHKPIKPFHVS